MSLTRLGLLLKEGPSDIVTPLYFGPFSFYSLRWLLAHSLDYVQVPKCCVQHHNLSIEHRILVKLYFVSELSVRSTQLLPHTPNLRLTRLVVEEVDVFPSLCIRAARTHGKRCAFSSGLGGSLDKRSRLSFSRLGMVPCIEVAT